MNDVEKEYYERQLQEGLEFQDYVSEILYNNGIIIRSFLSKKYSEKGENKFGIEIKYDKKFVKTGNLYLEYSEKKNSNNKKYIPSGISKFEDSWLYCIGNYDVFYIFGTHDLYIRRDEFMYKETPTSIGYLMKTEQAEKYYLNKFVFDKK